MAFTTNFNSLTSAKVHSGSGTLFPAVHHQQLPISSRPNSFISFTSPPYKSLFYSKPPIKAAAAASSKTHEPLPSTGANKPVLDSNSPFHLLKTSFIATAVAAAALFIIRTQVFTCKPAMAGTGLSSMVQSNETETLSDEEKEKGLKKFLLSDPNNVEALQSLMEIHVRNGRTEDSIQVVDKLIEIEPDEVEWPLMKAHIHAYSGEVELATREFVEIIVKHPLKVEAYHGLMLAVSQDEDSSKDEAMKEIQKKVNKAIEICEKEKKVNVLRDFKLMQAQIFVLEGKYSDALVVYQQLALDDPKDFRPYLCQGIIYTVMRKKNEAEKYFEKYRSLVPEDHPHTQYFEENMMATKAYAQEMDNASKT